MDRDAMTRLYRRVAPSLYAWASLKLTPALRRVIEVEDVVQEVWYRALDGFEAYDSSRSSFRTWVFGIANHVVLKSYRLLRRGAPRGGPDREVPDRADDVTSISRRLARDETLAACIRAISALDDEDRLLAIQCGLEGLGASHAAAELGISADAAGKRWQRLRGRLREAAPFKDLLAP
jgi:RNA polymerase sigma-70 factor (ECF subfamily)